MTGFYMKCKHWAETELMLLLKDIQSFFSSQQTCTCSNSTVKTLEKCVKYV